MLLKGGDSPAAQWCNVECTAQIRARSGGRIPFCEANTTRRRPTVTLIAKLATVIIDASNFKAGECITAPNSSDKMAADQQFCLRWNNHQSTLIQVFDTLLASEQLVDCTLAAEGQYLKAHKVVLSACSPYLELLLAQHYEKHPIVILKDVKFQELKSMMDYMYRGEVNISQDQLSTFLKAAESLQIKGLTDSGEDSRDVGSTKRVDGAAQGARKAAAATGAAAASSGSNRASPAVGGTGLTIEPRPASPHHRDASLSPTPRKRRRARRPSQGDAPDSHNDTSNSCDLPPASALAPPEQHIETEHINNRLQNSNNMELIKEKVEPTPELMIEPKTEYMDENNEDSVEDLTLDDDDDLDMNRSGMDMGRPGPSHGDSNQGFATSWHMQGDRSGTDEVFMAAQEAVGAAHRDSQGFVIKDEPLDELYEIESKPNFTVAAFDSETCTTTASDRENRDMLHYSSEEAGMMFKCPVCPKRSHNKWNLKQHIIFVHKMQEVQVLDNLLSEPGTRRGSDTVWVPQDKSQEERPFRCDQCPKSYLRNSHLKRHKKYECGDKDAQFQCPLCPKRMKQMSNLRQHIATHNAVGSDQVLVNSFLNKQPI
ncbi:longitudinals lacking protein, isoforms N/O/W/X/Y isoform X6 [Nilaparvata lugens]|uniref:longitudinals lacking protein, isoforms N/O/W/X/Y isoform X6 n=1 Tax=Nilaparvata lugens TaxID=108931 RepID=UPI00193E1FE1|nr:longitudinals lacking protein, isoforms N/O/W/X/Y isoform X6 [Nilaparvata lugens]